MSSIFRFSMILLILSGLIHIFTILATPFFAEQKVWERIISFSEDRTLTTIEDQSIAFQLLGTADPAMVYAICRFNLREGPVSLKAEQGASFWNVSIFNADAQMIYSLHDGASREGYLDLELRHISDRDTGPEVIIPDPAKLERLDPTIPLPDPRPFTRSERIEREEQLRQDLQAREQEDPTIKANLNLDNAFAVIKIFRPFSGYNQIINEILESTECS